MKPAAEMLRRIERGEDIPAPKSLLSRIKPEMAAAKPPNMPYSMLTNLAHMLFWQELWLSRLKGERLPDITNDWREPEPQEWPALRDRFIEGLQEAISIAEAEPFRHEMKSDEAATAALIDIGIHNAYHLGQIKLIKRSLPRS